MTARRSIAWLLPGMLAAACGVARAPGESGLGTDDAGSSPSGAASDPASLGFGGSASVDAGTSGVGGAGGSYSAGFGGTNDAAGESGVDAGPADPSDQPAADCMAPAAVEAQSVAPVACLDLAPAAMPPSYEEVGAACTGLGALACSAPNSQASLVCNAQGWEVLEDCGSEQTCALSSGVCTQPASECVDRVGGEAFCAGDDVVVCSADRVMAERVSCCGRCAEGVCLGAVCGDGRVQLDEECDDGNVMHSDGCENDCDTSRVVSLAGGTGHTCVLSAAGYLRCWGGNAYGQLGLGRAADYSECEPYAIETLPLGVAVVQIAVGDEHTCALLEDGTLRCWGRNHWGQLGLGHDRPVGLDSPPAADVATVNLGLPAISIAAGGHTTCAILAGGQLRCWGRNDFGQLGLGHIEVVGDDELPTETVMLDAPVRSVGVGHEHTCALMDGNLVRCWGRNDDGRLADGHTQHIGDDELPIDDLLVTFSPASELAEIHVAGRRACVFGADRTNCWGYNGNGRLGIGDTEQRPLQLAGTYGDLELGADNRAVGLGEDHSCLVLNDGKLLCFGGATRGQLGQPFIQTLGDDECLCVVPPVELGENATGDARLVQLLAVEPWHTCVVLDDNQLRCWGWNHSGQLGHGFPSVQPIDFVGGTTDTVPALLPITRVFR